MFLQPHAGRKQGRSLYESKVKPLFDVAGVIDDVTGKLRQKGSIGDNIHAAMMEKGSRNTKRSQTIVNAVLWVGPSRAYIFGAGL